MRTLLLLLCCVALNFPVYAAPADKKPKKRSKTEQTEPLSAADSAASKPSDMHKERMASFRGGTLMNFRLWVNDQIQRSQALKDADISGEVLVAFVIGTDGAVCDVEIARSSGESLLERVAVAVVRSSPRWEPAVQKGRYVKVKFTLPINYNR